MTQPQIQSETVQYPGHGGEMINAYISRPSGQGPYPGVIVTAEAFGLNDHIRDLARRFADRGYVSIAPDLYTREGAPDENNFDDVIQKMFASPDSRAVGDLDAAAVFLKGQAQSNGKVGIIGFCSGGRYTLMTACSSSNIDAAVDSAGGFIIQDELTPERPVSPIDMVANLSCPLMATFGEEDPNPSPDHAARLQEELDKHNKTYEFYMYPNAGHAFFADYRDSYRAAPAQDMWHRVLLFYGKHLGG
jgi:carboxymethylenebutenolidase